jgi:hypothetical protein
MRRKPQLQLARAEVDGEASGRPRQKTARNAAWRSKPCDGKEQGGVTQWAGIEIEFPQKPAREKNSSGEAWRALSRKAACALLDSAQALS